MRSVVPISFTIDADFVKFLKRYLVEEEITFLHALVFTVVGVAFTTLYLWLFVSIVSFDTFGTGVVPPQHLGSLLTVVFIPSDAPFFGGVVIWEGYLLQTLMTVAWNCIVVFLLYPWLSLLLQLIPAAVQFDRDNL